MPSEGLRERKRAATQAAIERAAVSLALEHGYDHVTVDMICEASMVAQRTFFNYFGSKEGVIMGAAPSMPSDQQIEEFAQNPGADVLEDFLALITTSLTDNDLSASLFQARRTLILRTPELLTKRTARMGEFEDQFVAIILRRYEAQGQSLSAHPELEDEARMIVSLSVGVLQYVMRKWLSAPAGTSTRDVLHDSIELIRRIFNNEPKTQEGKNSRP